MKNGDPKINRPYFIRSNHPQAEMYSTWDRSRNTHSDLTPYWMQKKIFICFTNSTSSVYDGSVSMGSEFLKRNFIGDFIPGWLVANLQPCLHKLKAYFVCKRFTTH